MNLGQAVDPEWVQAGCRRRPWERTLPQPDVAAVAARRASEERARQEAQAEAERTRLAADREVELETRRRREAAERMAEDRRARQQQPPPPKIKKPFRPEKQLAILQALANARLRLSAVEIASRARLPGCKRLNVTNTAAHLVHLLGLKLVKRAGASSSVKGGGFRYWITGAGRKKLAKYADDD